MSKTELLDYNALETIKKFDTSTIKENVAALSSIEQKIRYLEETNKELKRLIYLKPQMKYLKMCFYHFPIHLKAWKKKNLLI